MVAATSLGTTVSIDAIKPIVTVIVAAWKLKEQQRTRINDYKIPGDNLQNARGVFGVMVNPPSMARLQT